MAAPMITGSIGLLLQHQENLYGPDDPLLASTLKALIIHGADQNVSDATGPSYSYGWGLMDTPRCTEIMSQDAQAGGSFHIREINLASGSDVSISITASGSQPLRATLAWTDPPGAPPQPELDPPDRMLVNDLDLRITDEKGDEYFPYVMDPDNPSAPADIGDNSKDNVEMIHLQNPEPGQKYTLEISHKGTLSSGSQDLSLIITGNNRPPLLPGVMMLLLDK